MMHCDDQSSNGWKLREMTLLVYAAGQSSLVPNNHSDVFTLLAIMESRFHFI